MTEIGRWQTDIWLGLNQPAEMAIESVKNSDNTLISGTLEPWSCPLVDAD